MSSPFSSRREKIPICTVKFEEVHYQRAYDLATICRLLEEAGMEFVTAYDAFTKDAPRPESERIYVVAREKGKSEK